ncbi:MAG TPA: helix-turn-helix transcriptional regulator [Thermoanaerobaculia bacterium]|nr:helix-turn-helix transcriptional regulator [Thermoanaerobaculia bacterium]
MHTATHPPIPPIPSVPVLTGLGQALRWLRERQARKQYQVASSAGITKGMLSAYETGRQRPSLETLDKLLETLGCDLNDLHNALQIVNGRPEHMKGWRGGGQGLADAVPGWPDDFAAGAPAYGAHSAFDAGRVRAGIPRTSWSPVPPSGFASLAGDAGEVHEVTGRRGADELRRVLGLPDPLGPLSLDDSRAAASPPSLAPEEELALAQMLEGFHNLLRYWHRCLTGLAAALPANPSEAFEPVEAAASAPPPTGRLQPPGPAPPPRSPASSPSPRGARPGPGGSGKGKSGGQQKGPR